MRARPKLWPDTYTAPTRPNTKAPIGRISG
jgi:hypothetical protein